MGRTLYGFFFLFLSALSLLPVRAEEAPTPEPPPVGGSEYTIGVEDRLGVSVWHEVELSRTVSVRPDGMITFPLVGDIQASGRTPARLAQDLTVALKKYIKDPVVTVVVEEINHFRVYVLGEVTRQGELVLRKRTRLLEAIALAGGLTQFADKSNLVLIREEDGVEVRLRIDYRKVISGERADLNVSLMPGDTIVVN